jgi:hypothetical protein
VEEGMEVGSVVMLFVREEGSETSSLSSRT